jgi:hypothetical protein
MDLCPITHPLQDRDQLVAGGAQAVVNAWREGVCAASEHQAVAFEFAELGGEDLVTDTEQQVSQFAEAVRLEG